MKENLVFLVVHGSFVEGSWEACRILAAAEEEATTPKDEDRQANWNCEHYADQHPDEDRRVFFRPCAVHVQTTQLPIG